MDLKKISTGEFVKKKSLKICFKHFLEICILQPVFSVSVKRSTKNLRLESRNFMTNVPV